MHVGSILYGYCGGYFNGDSGYDKRIEVIGADYIVARDDMGRLYFCDLQINEITHDDLKEYLEKPKEDDDDWEDDDV